MTAASGREYLITPMARKVACPDENRWYCLQSKAEVPDADWGLAAKLWLEADEAGFLGAAGEFVDHSRRLAAYWGEREIAEAVEAEQRRYHGLREDIERAYYDDIERLAWDHNERLNDIYQTHRMVQHPDCRCDIEFTGPIYLETLEDARAYAERRDWRVDVTIDRGELPTMEIGSRWDRILYPEQAYEVDGRPTDERTVQLLRDAFQERDDARFEAGEAATERGRATLTQAEVDFLAGLPCPFRVEARENCDAVSAEN